MNWNKLLRRQIKKSGLNPSNMVSQTNTFIDMVHKSYNEFDISSKQLNESLRLNKKELSSLYEKLRLSHGKMHFQINEGEKEIENQKKIFDLLSKMTSVGIIFIDDNLNGIYISEDIGKIFDKHDSEMLGKGWINALQSIDCSNLYESLMSMDDQSLFCYTHKVSNNQEQKHFNFHIHKLTSNYFCLFIEECSANLVYKDQNSSLFLNKLENKHPLVNLAIESFVVNDASDPSKKALIEKIQNFSESFLSLFSDISEFSKLALKQKTNKPQDIELTSFLSNLISHFNSHSLDNGNTIEFNIDPETPPSIPIDSEKISRIILNILDNANYFTRNGKIETNLRIDRSKNLGHLIIEITDNGQGIPQHISEQFGPQYSQQNALNSSHHSLGMGLAICRETVSALDGHMTCKSQKLAGTQIIISIPFGTELNPESRNSHQNTSPMNKELNSLEMENDEGQLRVVFVGKSTYELQAMQIFLESLDCHVAHVESQESADIEVFGNNYDLVFWAYPTLD